MHIWYIYLVHNIFHYDDKISVVLSTKTSLEQTAYDFSACLDVK